jgi:hypothetical protein
MRSVSISTDKEQIAKNFMRSFIELVEHFIDQEAHLDTVYKCLTALFDVMSVDDRSLVLKKILMHFLKKFPVDYEDITKADEYIEKTLDLWRIFGMCSKTMGPVAILEKIEETYIGCWQYYKMYAESLIEENRPDELYKTFKNCMEHCDLNNEEVRKIFGPKIMSRVKFPELSEEDEDTVQFMQIHQSDIRKSMAAHRRSIVPKEDSKYPKAGLSERKVIVPKEDSKNPKAVLSERKPIVPAKVEISTIVVPPKDDFSVFKDPTILPVQHKTFTGNTENLIFQAPPKAEFPAPRNPPIQLGQRKSFDANSPTVCGTHLVPKKPANTADPLLTSTPDNARKIQPKFDL